MKKNYLTNEKSNNALLQVSIKIAHNEYHTTKKLP